MKTILVTTYAVNPYKGSEDGMGWNFILQIARFQKIIAITRENNQINIDKYMLENPSNLYQNIQFLYFDTPYWMRFWKKGGRGAMLYYILWQYAVVSFIKSKNIQYDIVHNLNFHNDWTPSFLWKLKKPFVWGPIGHHPLIPQQYLVKFSPIYFLKDRLTWLIKKYFWKYSISLNNTVKYSNHILCMNSSVKDVLSISTQNTTIMPSVATEDFGVKLVSKTDNKFTLISAGRLVPLKGFDLTILSFSKFVNSLSDEEKTMAELIIVGSGQENDTLENLVKENEISHNVKFIDWIAREDLLTLYKSADAFIFPSHEGAGMVVAEALSFGLPVICLDNEGPGEFINSQCGYKISPSNYETTVNQLSESIRDLYINKAKRYEMSKAARLQFETKFHWDRRGESLNKIYQSL